MEVDSWELLKSFMSWVVYPVIAGIGYLYKRQSLEVSMLKSDVEKLKIDQAVTTSQIKDIREDIKDLTAVVREAERTITHDIKILRQDILHGKD